MELIFVFNDIVGWMELTYKYVCLIQSYLKSMTSHQDGLGHMSVFIYGHMRRVQARNKC